MMLEQAVSALSDPDLGQSSTIFCDIVRLIMALQLSVANSQFGNENISTKVDTPKNDMGGVSNSGILLS